jgi:hypothetical protein
VAGGSPSATFSTAANDEARYAVCILFVIFAYYGVVFVVTVAASFLI